MNWDCESTTLFLAEDRISELDAARRLALLEHLEVCAECAAQIAEERALDRLLDAFFSDAPAADAPSGVLDELPSVACCFVDAPGRSPFAALAARSAAAPWHKKLAWAACAVLALTAAAWGFARIVRVCNFQDTPLVKTEVTLPDGTKFSSVSGTTLKISTDNPAVTPESARKHYDEVVELIKAGKATVTVSDLPDGDGMKIYSYTVTLPDGRVDGIASGLPLDSPLTLEDRSKELADFVKCGKLEFIGLKDVPPYGQFYRYRVKYSDGAVEIVPSKVPLITVSVVPLTTSK